MIILENEYLKASFALKGAELQSLINKENDVNYLWSGDPAIWAKFSPVLFPVVGGLKDDTYYFEQTAYHLPRHGFAREMDFEAIQVSDTELVLKLHHNADTLKKYPFEFLLQLRYCLKGPALSCTYEVSNPSSDRPLLFSLGAHPAFSVPLKNNLLYGDYFLEFNNDQALLYHKISDNLIEEETVKLPLTDGRLHLKHELFYNDALVMKSLKSNCISIRTEKDQSGIHFKFKDFPFFGIWAAKNANFVCLEPWCGIADGIRHQQDLTTKEGIVRLAPLDRWTRSWEVTCF